MATTIADTTLLDRTPGQVLALLADPDFIRRRTACNPGLSGELLAHQADEQTIRIETRAQMPSDWLPGRVRGAVRALPRMYRRELWHRQTGSGTTEFEITGVPAHASATMSVTARDDGCELLQTVRIEVKMPIVAGLVEQAIATQIRRSLRAEAPAFEAGAGS